MKLKIYTLSSTRDIFNIRYIGKTTDPLKKRLTGHLFEAKQKKLEGYTHNHKCNWINKELSEGFNIIIEEIDSMELDDKENWQWLEQYWIAQFKVWGIQINKYNYRRRRIFWLYSYKRSLFKNFLIFIKSSC